MRKVSKFTLWEMYIPLPNSYWLGWGSLRTLVAAMQFIITPQNEIKKYNLHELDLAHETSYVDHFPSFKNQDSLDWVAFWNLLQRPWFSRLWVRQEMVLSGRAILACGRETAQWDELTIVVDILLSKGLGGYLRMSPDGSGAFKVPRGVGGLSAMDDISAWRTVGQALPLQKLLLIGRSFDATNPQDFILGLLGVATDIHDVTMPPNYQQSTDEIFLRWTRFLITQDGKATLLHRAGLGQTRGLKNILS
jgi:hypothetical protein